MATKQIKPNNAKPKQNHSKALRSSYILKLYIAGVTTKAVTALNNLKLICEEQLEGKYHIEIIDLLKNPKLGREDQILAIPTLMRKLPLPVKLVIGDLSNTERVLAGLGIN